MKLLVCCVIVISNISNNGKASHDSFAPANMNKLLEDTTRSSDASCHRPCKLSVKPRRCHYNFNIEPTVKDGNPSIAINGLTPGPPIIVCLNDVIVVEVQNKIPDQDIAVHWHGVQQKGTPFMDGVPMVTQCPISYGSTYKYAFKASAPGTFFYHADSVAHQSDGVYGSLVVNQPQPLDPHSTLYDYDRSLEHSLIFGAKFPQLMTGNLEDLTLMRPTGLVVNGDEMNTKVFVIPSFAYKLRLINAIAVECPLRVRIEGHEMMVIATDGRPVKPVLAKHVLLYPGERMDVVVRATKATGGYWMEIFGDGVCYGTRANAMLIYSGFNYTSMIYEGPVSLSEMKPDSDEAIYGQKLESLHNVNYNSETEVTPYYLGIDRSAMNLKESDVDFQYISDALPAKPFYPASLFVQKSAVTINGKNFLYPSAPILLKPRKTRPDPMCVVGSEHRVKDPQCVHILNSAEGEVLELALVNEGFGSNESYTFHMHGYSMQVISTWQNPTEKPLSKEDFKALDEAGEIIRNQRNLVIKDTVTVPNKGAVVVRIRPEQGGSWLLECRSCGLSSLPAALIVNVPISIPRVVVDSLPKCDTFKPPDVLLN